MKGLTKIFKWLNLLLILVTFLAYLSPYINPQTFSWINIFGTAYPWLLFANLLFVLLWSILKNRYVFFSICCIIMGWNHLTNFVGLNLSQGPEGQNDFNIMTYNASGLLHLAYDEKNKKEHAKKVSNFKRFLHQNGEIDILCLQEVSDVYAKKRLDLIEYKYKKDIPYLGTSILSKHPILQSGEISFGTKTNSCVWADISIHGKTLRVYNIHLKSNRVSTQTEQILKKGSMQEKETWENIQGVFGSFRYTSKIRVDQAQKVRTHMEQCPHPFVLCGDFNETPQSYVYRLLSDGLEDTFQEKGFGIGSTYAGSIPALRIDYILTTPYLKIRDCKILKEAYSDHYPVMARLAID